MTTTSPGLRSEALAVWRGDRCLFEGLDFALGAGQLALVVGSNGAGKTSLLRVLAGLSWPSGGTVTWTGTAVASLTSERRADIAYWGHQDGIKKELTVLENLEFHASLWQSPLAIDSLLAEVKLEHVSALRARHLSAGQRRRAMLAMLKLSGAKLWLLDEPMTNLDSDGRHLIIEWTARHLRGGGLAVIATHQPDDFAVPGTFMIELS